MSVVELKFYAWNAPNGTLLGTLTDADLESFEIRPEHRGAGSGHFTISRTNPNATTALLGFGHNSLAGPRLVKVHYPWMPAPYDTEPAWAFWLWEGDFSLLNQDGDDTLTFSGPGVRGIWSEYVLYHSSTTDDQPARGSADRDDLWWWINEPYGAIATRIFEEGRHAPYPGAADANSTFQFVTIDFDRVTDSDGQTWSNIAEEYQQSIGTDAGTVLADLEEAGDFTLVGTPDLLFSAYEAYGDDLTGTAYGSGIVRVQGDTGTDADNILSDLSRHAILNQQRTHLLGRDKDSDYFTEIHPSYSSGPERWRSVAFDETNDDTLLNKKAAQIFVDEGHAQNAIEVELKPGNSPSTGRYLPFVHFKTGDTVTVDTGSGEHDYTNEDALLSAFRVVLAEASAEDADTDDNRARSLHVILELNTARTGGGIPSSSAGTGGIGCRCPRPCSALTPGTELLFRFYPSGDDGAADPAMHSGWDTAVDTSTNTLKTAPDDSYPYTLGGIGRSSSAGGDADGRNVLYWAGMNNANIGSSLAAVLAAGGATIRGQFPVRARYGIGISESSQHMIANLALHVTAGATTTIRGTALAPHTLATYAGAVQWPPQNAHINRRFPAVTASDVLSAVPGTVSTDRILLELGSRNYTLVTSGGSLVLISDTSQSDSLEDDSSAKGPNTWVEIRAISAPAGEGHHPDLVGTDKDYARCDHTHHVLANRDPNTADDITQGYPTTTLWTNTETHQSFVLVDEDTGDWQPFATAGEHTHSIDDVEGLADALDESATGEHGDLTGLADNDHPQYRLTTDGGQDVINVVSASGSTETLDLATGNVHDVTLTANCTLTLTGATAGVACDMAILLRQGTGAPWTVTWPGSVEWVGGSAPVLETAEDAWNWVALTTLDGGTTWFGSGGATSSIVAALDDLTDVTVTAPAEGDMLRFDGSVWVNTPGRWEPVTNGVDTFVWDGDEIVMTWSDT